MYVGWRPADLFIARFPGDIRTTVFQLDQQIGVYGPSLLSSRQGKGRGVTPTQPIPLAHRRGKRSLAMIYGLGTTLVPMYIGVNMQVVPVHDPDSFTVS